MFVNFEFDIFAQNPYSVRQRDDRNLFQAYSIGGRERSGIFDSRRK